MSDSDAKDSYNDSSSRDSVLQSSRLNAPLRSSVLRPSLFTALSNNDSSEKTSAVDSASVNPFLKDEPEQKDHDENSKKEEDESKEETNDSGIKADPLSLLSKNGLSRSNIFSASQSSAPRIEQTGFVFGKNVHERVIGAENTSKIEEESKEEKTDETKDSEKSGSTELLFSNAIQNNKSDEITTPKETDTKSLTEVAREYEESRAQKRKYEEVETFTGEENEVNIIDINCKLFAFVNRNWEERGRGSLRLNDSKDENGCSRVVFRTSGNLRLLVNTKVWNGMVVERPSQKSLRLTAMDNTGQIKVFLIMSRPDDISILFKALTKRVLECKTVDLTNSENDNGNEHENEIDNDSNSGKNEKNNSEQTYDVQAEDKYEPSQKKTILDEN